MDKFLIDIKTEGREAIRISNARTHVSLVSFIPMSTDGYQIDINQNLDPYEKASLVEVLAFFMSKYMGRCNIQKESITEMQEELDRLNRIVYTV